MTQVQREQALKATLTSPCITREQLTRRFPARVRVPELRREHEAAKRLNAAGVYQARDRAGRAREHGVLQGAGVVFGAQARVEAGDGAPREERRGAEESETGGGHGFFCCRETFRCSKRGGTTRSVVSCHSGRLFTKICPEEQKRKGESKRESTVVSAQPPWSKG
jgi:hypothetical protein